MLDLLAVAGQLRRMRADLAGMSDAARPRLARALEAYAAAAELGPALRDRVARARTSWLVADPLEPLVAYDVAPADGYRVVASDGSQVFPDRHEAAGCYLVNVGVADIEYASGRASLRTEPVVLYLPDDVYPLVGGVRQEADGRVVAARRFAAECDALTASVSDGTLLLTDGTLLLWWLEPDPARLRSLEPDDVKSRTLASLERLFDASRDALLAGYLSAPRSTDVVSMLKVVLCTEDPVDCDRCPYADGSKTWQATIGGNGLLPDPSKPCEEAETVVDAALFASLLSPGQRSARFRSAARVAEAYPCPVDFVYLHAGGEVARLEFPAWSAPAALDALCAAVLDQCRKGMGYPVALAEAHEQAVVRAADRRAFLDLVARGSVSHVSAKLARKQRSVL